MKRSIFYASLVLAVTVSIAMTASATIVNFDDLVGDDLPVPDGYGGINWNGRWSYYSTDQRTPYIPHSPPVRVYGYGAVTPFDFITPSVFDGAWFSGQTSTVQLNLYSGGSLVASSSVLPTTEVPTFLSSGYSGLVNEVQVVTSAPLLYVMDDVTYNSVPIPSAVWLLGSGLIGLVGVRRRFRKHG